MTWYFVRPTDVWMFREAKPFAAGQSFVARSVFPPYPQTMQGVIRTHILELASVNWSDYYARRDSSLRSQIGAPAIYKDNQLIEPAEFGMLKLEGPFVAEWDDTANQFKQRLFPVPFDVLQHKKYSRQTVILFPNLHWSFASDVSHPDPWWPLDAVVEEDEALIDYDSVEGWLEEDVFHAYLSRRIPPRRILNTNEVLERDERVGLALDYTRRSHRDRHLYHAEFARPYDGIKQMGQPSRTIGLLISVNPGLLPDEGVLRIGGEGRTATYRSVNYSSAFPSVQPGWLKIVLLTPAFFKNGWSPEKGWSKWVGEQGKLVSAALGKPIPISGWDVANNRPKPQYNLVPAGSVYYFKDATPPQTPFTETPDNELDYAAMGFGTCAVGSWHELVEEGD